MNEFKNSHIALQGKTLIANKSLDGSYFEKTVIFIFSHDADGALGIILNKLDKTYSHKQIALNFPRVKELINKESKINVYTGGPMDDEKHYVLFSDKSVTDQMESITLFDNTEIFLRDSYINKSNEPYMLVKGFCSWGPLQLESEVKEGSWLVTSIEPKAIFDQNEKKYLWNILVKKLGISNFKNLVSYTGNA